MDKQMEAKRMDLGGSFTLPAASITLNRMGYGAMQLAGPEVWGPPRDVDGAIAVLREAVTVGVNHIDTKVGAPRGEDKSWLHALSRQELIDAVYDNLRNLGIDKLDVVNLRVGGV